MSKKDDIDQYLCAVCKKMPVYKKEQKYCNRIFSIEVFFFFFNLFPILSSPKLKAWGNATWEETYQTGRNIGWRGKDVWCSGTFEDGGWLFIPPGLLSPWDLGVMERGDAGQPQNLGVAKTQDCLRGFWMKTRSLASIYHKPLLISNCFFQHMECIKRI